MDFVRAEDEVALLGEGGEPAEFGAREDGAAGILRIAQHQQARFRPRGSSQRIFVPDPAAFFQHQRHFGECARRELGRALQVVIHGLRHEHVLVRAHQVARGQVQAGHHARDEHHPLGRNRPAVQALHALDHRGAQCLGRRAVAEHAVRNTPLHRLQHRRWRAEIGVRHP